LCEIKVGEEIFNYRTLNKRDEEKFLFCLPSKKEAALVEEKKRELEMQHSKVFWHDLQIFLLFSSFLLCFLTIEMCKRKILFPLCMSEILGIRFSV
jgi:hypothetical protein